jgi:hypothetical protein
VNRHGVLAWLVVFAGPASWILDFMTSYVAAPIVRAGGSRVVMGIATVLALLVTALATAIGARWLRGREPEPSRFLVLFGLGLNAFFLCVIVATAVPKIILRAGD